VIERTPSRAHDVPVRDDPIFVPGTPGLGSETLASALSVHSQLAASGEVDIVSRIRSFGPVNGPRPKRFRKLPQHYSGNPHWPAEGEPDDRAYPHVLADCLSSLYSSRIGALRWIDSTPDSLIMAPTLIEMFSRSKFLIVLSDLREEVREARGGHSRTNTGSTLDRSLAVASYFARSGRWNARPNARTAGQASIAWRRHMSRARAFAREHSDRCCVLQPEELEACPDSAFRRIYDRLKLPFEQAPIDAFLAK
jgi:hypothetical protein